MTDEFDEIEPGRRTGAHRQESAAHSNIGAITLVIVLALVAVLLVVAAINIIFSSMGNPESKVADHPAEETSSAEPSPSESEVSVADDSITVDVLNGSGKSGVAKKFSEVVEEKGWKLGQVGNYSTGLTTSTVYYSGEDNASQAKLVAESLGIDATEASEDFEADVTVVICSDKADSDPGSGGSGSTEESSTSEGAGTAEG